MRTFRQGGFDEVVAYRRWQAREWGIVDWREIGKTRYGIRPGVNEIKGDDNAGQTVPTGSRSETTPGAQDGQQEPNEGVRVRGVPLSSEGRRDQGAEEAIGSPGSVSPTGSANEVQQVQPGGRPTGPVSEGLSEERSDLEPTRAQDRNERQATEAP